MKNKQCHTVGTVLKSNRKTNNTTLWEDTVPKSNRKITGRGKIDTPNSQIHSTGTSIKCRRVFLMVLIV